MVRMGAPLVTYKKLYARVAGVANSDAHRRSRAHWLTDIVAWFGCGRSSTGSICPEGVTSRNQEIKMNWDPISFCHRERQGRVHAHVINTGGGGAPGPAGRRPLRTGG